MNFPFNSGLFDRFFNSYGTTKIHFAIGTERNFQLFNEKGS